MSVSVSLYQDSGMTTAFSNDNSYSLPVNYGSLAGPLNGLTGDVGDAFGFWLKNTGTTKLTDIVIYMADGEVSAQGGSPSSTDDAYIEFALDDGSNAPSRQTVQPATFVKASSSSEFALIPVTNVIDVSNSPKSITSLRADDDARTMMPNEYSIIWTRAVIDAARAPGGTLPTPAGIKNVKIIINAKAFEI
jgi:hypothetical protein